MNLKIDQNGFKLEIQNGDASVVERVMIAAFAFLEGESFIAKYESLPVPEKAEKKGKYTPVINGIKILNGVEHYRCRYRCMCGNGGERFVKKDAVDTTCHACKSLLTVVPAAEGKEHDEEFNYYIAY